MKPYQFCILLSLLFFLSSCSNYTCEDFKTGEYVYADSAYQDVRITRILLGEQEFYVDGPKEKDPAKAKKPSPRVKMKKMVGEQTEVMTLEGKEVTDIYTMIWDGPCTYSLVFKSTSSRKDQFHTQYDTIRVNVLDIDGDRFKVRANLGSIHPEAELIKLN